MIASPLFRLPPPPFAAALLARGLSALLRDVSRRHPSILARLGAYGSTDFLLDVMDAPVLLLDEATSALDVETERRVLRNIMTQKPNKTCIVTTHRPSVLNMCRRVYRVMDTRVTELSEEEAAKMAMDF